MHHQRSAVLRLTVVFFVMVGKQSMAELLSPSYFQVGLIKVGVVFAQRELAQQVQKISIFPFSKKF